MNTMTKEWQKRDKGLTARMIFCFFILALLYAVFIGVLAYVGIGFIPIMIVASAMIVAQWYFSDKIGLWRLWSKGSQ